MPSIKTFELVEQHVLTRPRVLGFLIFIFGMSVKVIFALLEKEITNIDWLLGFSLGLIVMGRN